MQIEITYEKEDWRKYSGYITSMLPKAVRSPLDKGWVNVLIWLYIGFFIVMILKNLESIHAPTAVYEAIFLSSLYLIFRPNKKKLLEAYAPMENGVFIGEHKYTFTDEGIGHTTDGYKGFHSWTNVIKIVRVNGMIMLFVDTESAFIFPEEKIEDPDALYNFALECNKALKKDAENNSAS
ncbi:YcxB family protein [Aliikangiella sp. G2MR2-5]|uniref:YcxB family protein n=1 Tax=Aliikangiella sp. G2MR2-5 TaxID=2788943 RepID=UPI0018A8DF30|nr:YcxB family protein [Aliikangiella sp. G2MR2-5]